MIADLKPYPIYKTSLQAWLGDIPGHWALIPNRAVFAEVKDRDHPEEEMLSVTITRGIVRQRALLEGSSKKDASNLDKSAYKLVQPGDIAYNKMRAWQGAIGASALRGIVSPAYVVMRFHNDEGVPAYFHHLFRTPQFAKEAERWSYGITSDMWSLRPEHFKMIYSPVPPAREQTAIVRYLDWACGRLDRAIWTKRKIIALLNEQKQAIIHRAVTRGLDPNVLLKPSGVSWLGDIPSHWDVVRVKGLLKAIDRRSSTGQEELLSVRMHHGIVLFREHFQRPPQARTLVNFKLVEPGQFVVNRMQAGNGLIYCSGLAGLVSPDYSVFETRVDLNPEFLGMLFRSSLMRWKFRVESKGLGTGTSGFLRLYDDRFAAVHIALPPRSEQDLIMDQITVRLRDPTREIERVQREVDLLREYRTRLIAEVVTGKLDVRDAATKLPAETEAAVEPEAAEPEPDEEDLAIVGQMDE